MSIRLENGARAQIELNLDNTRESNARKSERYYLEDRYKIEGRLVFIKSLENESRTEEENNVLSSYKEVCKKIHTESLTISKFKREIDHYESIKQPEARENYSKNNYTNTMIDFAKREISKATANLNELENKAIALEKTENIQNLYHRAYATAISEHEDDLADLLDEKINKFERAQRPPEKKQTVKHPSQELPKNKFMQRLKEWWISNGDKVLEILAYFFTMWWFGYIAQIVYASDSSIFSKIFFTIWSLVLAFIFLVHKSTNSKK